MISRVIGTSAVLCLLATPLSAQQVVFSRRVYAAAGRTYQQLWIWSASDGSLKPLTHSPRDHSEPVCSVPVGSAPVSTGAPVPRY
jgi:hypothetical protein